MKLEREYFQEIEKLIKGNKKIKALEIVGQLSIKVDLKPSYAGYYWRAMSYFTIDKVSLSNKVLKDVEECEFLFDKIEYEKQVPAKVLKAKALFFLNELEKSRELSEELIKKVNNADAFFIRGLIKAKKGEEDALDDIKKAGMLGNTAAAEFIHNRNHSKNKNKK